MTPKLCTHRVNVFCAICGARGLSYIYGFIPIGGDFLDRLVKLNDDGFFEAIHAVVDLEIYVPISFKTEIVLVYDFLWHHSVVYVHVLEI